MLTVVLRDGRELRVPLRLFPRLAHASMSERRSWNLIGGGLGIEWPVVDEHISVAGLLQPELTITARTRRTSRSARVSER
jgi:hypothetical protein